jgi:hypothetical protein
MTPTQEQILKDALEIIATDEKTYIGHGDYYEGPFSGEYCQRVARKALTAAAGVGEQSFGPWWENAKKTIERDTIERCAQVAENWAGERAKGFSKTPEMHTAESIAAAIRALKDKP